MRIDDKKVIFAELSYQIIGAAFKVFNEIGYGLPEKAYQKALEKELGALEIKFEREVHIPLQYRDENLLHYFADFIVEGKIVLELKVVKKLGYSHASQILAYLKSSGKKLGILLYFTIEGVKYRRVINSEMRI